MRNEQKPETTRSDHAEQARWEQAAATWVDDADDIALMTQGATDSLLSALCPLPRESILDLACGPGDPSLSLARLVGSEGRVLSTDAVAPMVAALQQRAQVAGLEWLETLVCPAQELKLPPASFDGACCRFGAMFFANLPEVLARVSRALVPGGRVVFVVWGEARFNPYFTCSSGVLSDLGAPVPSSDEQTATVFELAEPGDLAGRLVEAGFVNVQETAHDFAMVHEDTTAEQFLGRQLARSTPLAERFEQLSESEQAKAHRLVTEKMSGYQQEGRLLIPAQCLAVRGETVP